MTMSHERIHGGVAVPVATTARAAAIRSPVVPAEQDAHADPLRRGVRRCIWVAFALAIANGVFLYFLPARAEAEYAWAIRPPISAAFMGAGYLSGVLATGLSLFVARYWRSVWGLFWPFFTIASVELLATILHADRFRWDYWPTWLWTLTYVGIPPTIVLLWLRQQRGAHKRPPMDMRLARLKALAWVLGGVVTLFGVLLFLTPGLVIPHWPWEITPLLARAFSAWYLQMGITLLFAAATLRQAHEALIPYSWLAAINGLVLLLPVLHASTVRAGTPEFWCWLVVHAVLFAGAAWATTGSLVGMRMGHQRL
jgi:hypothetical protein